MVNRLRGGGAGGDAGGGATKTGRRPGASHTRDRISAAAPQFAERGYEQTTMRSISAEAGVDLSLAAHFFGTKKRLFDKVIDLPVDPATLRAGSPVSRPGVTASRTRVDGARHPHARAPCGARPRVDIQDRPGPQPMHTHAPPDDCGQLCHFG
jgi:hypothetical protein